MKTCPSCGAKYSDDLSFCLQDGSRLLAGVPTNDLIAGPTEEYRPGATNRQDLPEFDTLPSQPTVTPQIAAPQTVKQYRMSAVDPSSKMGCLVTVGQVSLGLLLVSLVGLGGFYFYSTRGNSELAQSEPKFSNTSSAAELQHKLDGQLIFRPADKFELELGEYRSRDHGQYS